jgi:hypothetical protein
MHALLASLTASASAAACSGIKGKEENGGGDAGGLKSCKGQPPSRRKGKVKSDRSTAKEASLYEAEEVEVAGSLLCS